jgi:hypothetical protein
MLLRTPDPDVDDWQSAEDALTAAQKMPAGPERIAALKEAGQLRFEAYKRRRLVPDLADRENERLRRGQPRESTPSFSAIVLAIDVEVVR